MDALASLLALVEGPTKDESDHEFSIQDPYEVFGEADEFVAVAAAGDKDMDDTPTTGADDGHNGWLTGGDDGQNAGPLLQAPQAPQDPHVAPSFVASPAWAPTPSPKRRRPDTDMPPSWQAADTPLFLATPPPPSPATPTPSTVDKASWNQFIRAAQPSSRNPMPASLRGEFIRNRSALFSTWLASGKDWGEVAMKVTRSKDRSPRAQSLTLLVDRHCLARKISL
jgi:hypothetical protein